MLALALSLLEELAKLKPAEGLAETVRTTMAALEAAAPPSSPEGSQDCADWFLVLLREARARVEDLLPSLYASRLALEADLLPQLSPGELNELAPQLVAVFPQKVTERLATSDLPEPVVAALLRACRDGLLGKDLGGEGWDVVARPETWDLAAQVAVRAAGLLVERETPEISSDLAWLLWGASRLVSSRWAFAGEESYRRMAEALDAVVADCPEGMADVVLRVVYRFHRFGTGFSPRREPWLRLRRQAWEDARRAGSSQDFHFGTLMRMAYLDRSLGSGSPASPG
jgi:hypothetical protein